MKICPDCRIRYADAQERCVLCGGALQPLAEETAAPAPEERAARPSPARRPLGSGRRFLAGLLCAFLFFSLTALSLCLTLRRASEPAGLRRVLDEVSLSGLRVDPFFDDVDEPLTLGALLSEDLAGLGLALDADTVAALTDSAPVKDFLAQRLAAVLLDLKYGRDGEVLDREALTALLLGAETQRLLAAQGAALSPEDAERAAELLLRYGLADFLRRETLERELPTVSRALRLGLDERGLAALLALNALLLFLVLLADRFRPDAGCRDVGGTCFAAGLLPCLGALFARFLPALWLGLWGDLAPAAAAARALLELDRGFRLGLLAAGLLLMLLGRLLRPRDAA